MGSEMCIRDSWCAGTSTDFPTWRPTVRSTWGCSKDPTGSTKSNLFGPVSSRNDRKTLVKTHRLFCGLLAVVILAASPGNAFSWSKGHRLIRLWAVARLPKWQRDLLGTQALARLCKEYTSLQDRHAGGNAPELDPYCIVPGVRLSLHDVNPAAPLSLIHI